MFFYVCLHSRSFPLRRQSAPESLLAGYISLFKSQPQCQNPHSRSSSKTLFKLDIEQDSKHNLLIKHITELLE